MNDYVLFAVAPYVALALLGALTLWRLSNVPQSSHQGSFTNDPPVFAIGRRWVARHPVATIAAPGLLAGHVIAAEWPTQLLAWDRGVARLIALELSLFVLGLAAAVGVAGAIGRRLRGSFNASATAVDAAFLGVTLAALLSGIAAAAGYRWVTAWSAVTVAPYARSLARLEPNVDLLRGLPYLARLHIFSGVVALGLLPFTHWFAAALKLAFGSATVRTTPFVLLVNRKREALQAWAVQVGERLIWPEEQEEEEA